MEYGKNKNILEGSIPKSLLIFSLPILIGNILQSLNGTINSIWVGKFLGESAFAATSNANNIMFFLFSFIFGIGMAATILIGQNVGSGNIKEAKKVAGTSATFFFILALGVTTAGLLFSKDILTLLHTPSDAMKLAVVYLKITFLGIPLMFGFNYLMMVLRGAGDAKTPFFFLILSTIIDITLNPLLIRGISFFPKMGIAGSATSAVIAQLVAFIFLLAFIYHKKHFLRLEKHELSYLKLNRKIIKEIVSKGIPMSMQMIVISSSMILLINLMNTFGTEATAAFGASMQIASYVQMPAMAIGGAVSTLAAQNIGAKEWKRVSKITTWGIVYNFLLTGIIVFLIYVFETGSAKLFLKEAEAVHLTVIMNKVSVWSFIIFGLTFVFSSVIQANGKVILPLIFTIVSLWFVRIPFAYFIGNKYGIESVMWCMPFGFIVGHIMTLIYYISGKWKNKKTSK